MCPFPQIWEEIVEVVSLVPQARVQQRVDEQSVDVPLPQIMKEPVEVFKIVPQESFSDRICEQIVDVPVPQVDELEALQFQVRAISHEMHGKCSDGKSSSEEFLTKTHELEMQLGECSKKINVLRDQKSGIFGQVRDRVAECLVRDKSKLMAEIAVLESSTLEISEYKTEEEIGGVSFFYEWWCVTDINEQMGVLMEDKKSHSAAVDQLVSERRNVTGYIKGLCDQRDCRVAGVDFW